MVVMESVKRRLNRGEAADLYFMRTSHGVEVDLVAETEGRLSLCEIKAGTTFHDDMADNIRSLCRLIPGATGQKSVVYAGRETSTGDGIQAKPFFTFGM